MNSHSNSGNEQADLENFKILRSIWKNTYDKMLEIKVANRRSWNESKKTIMEEEKKKIDAKYDKEYTEQYIANKIQTSEARNNSNLNKMRKRNELIEKLSSETLNKIKIFARADNEQYKTVLKNLILQGLVKLLEPVCVLQVRKSDVAFIKKVKDEIEINFTKLMREQTGEEYKCTLEVDEINLENDCGGVLMRSKDKKITLINDLESRLKLAFEQQLPVVKNMLFPKKK